MPVSISLGLWSTRRAYLISIPLVSRTSLVGVALFDTLTSASILVA